jgi:hypothetical protein
LTQRIPAHPRFPVAALVGIFVVSWAVWGWIASRHAYPNLFPDEMYYGKISQSLANGDGYQWRGTSNSLPPLWPLLLSIGWRFGSVPETWKVLKVLCAGLASTAVFPAWLLARTYVSENRALVAAALVVLGPWMAVTPFIISENLAYPLATAAFACLVTALRTARMRWLAYGLVFAALASATRTQMLSLFVIFVVALLLDVARHGRSEWRARFDAWPRALWGLLGGGVIALIGLFVVKPDLTTYHVLGTPASIGKIVSTATHHAATSIVAFGFVSVVVLFALMMDRANWRDEKVGPLLVTITAAALVMFPLLARFEAWATIGAPVERYTMYLAPLMGLVLVLAAGRVTPRRTAIACALTVAALFAVPHFYNQIEQPGLYGIQHRFEMLGGYFGDHLTLAVVLIGALVVTGAGAALSMRRRPMTGFAIALGIVAAVMVVQSSTFHHALVADEQLGRPLIGPAQLDWVDRAAKGPVAMLAIGKGEPFHQNPDLYTDFFNKKIKTLYSTEPVGAQECELDLKAHGVFHPDSGHCPAWPQNFLLLERAVHVTLQNSTILATTPKNGWLVRVPAGGPKVFGLVKPPCTVDGCTGTLQLGLYLDKKASVAVTFGASTAEHAIKTGQQVHAIPAGRNSTVRFQLPKGDQAANLPVNWNTPDGPPLRSVFVKTGGKTVRIY